MGSAHVIIRDCVSMILSLITPVISHCGMSAATYKNKVNELENQDKIGQKICRGEFDEEEKRAFMSFAKIFPYTVDGNHINCSILCESANNTQQIFSRIWL